MKRIIIDNIETKYLISENGEVFSEYKNIFLKSSTTQHGYSSVTLSVNGKKIRKYIHRLVAEYYLGFQEKRGGEGLLIILMEINKIIIFPI